ncbi:MAG: hypothetical protein R3C01_17010 [Planctomycetaceae bacterium]
MRVAEYRLPLSVAFRSAKDILPATSRGAKADMNFQDDPQEKL